MDRKVALRECIGCREQFDKRELIRVVKTPEGDITLDFKGKMNGRGAYLCKNPACLQKACKNKGLERAFKISIPEEVYEKLNEEFKDC